MNRNGLKIGEFSRLCSVTVRALRHYEKINLLVPEIIDYSTGYRYYSVGQMQKALNIVKLKGPSYDELGKLCYMTIGPEMARLGCECPEPGYCYTIEHGGYRKENIDIEYCEQVAAMGKDSDIIKFKQIPQAAEAVCMKVYGPYDRLNENIREVLEWIEANGYAITYPPRYSYVDGIWNQEDPEKWLTIIQVPVTR